MLTSVRDQITRDLRSRLLASEWPTGTRLKEEALATEFGVSRGPIRDVVLELTKEGYLQMLPNRGVTVAAFTKSRARSIYLRTRRDLELLALKRGFARWTEADFAQIRKILSLFKMEAEAANLSGVIQHDLAFHRFIIERYKDESLIIVWLPLMTTLALPYSRHGDLMESYQEHVEIVNALGNGELFRAAELLKQHIQ